MNKLLIGAALAALGAGALAQAPAPIAGQGGERIVTRDAMIAKTRERFARLDANRDGYVVREEMMAMRGQHMGMRHQRMGQGGGRDPGRAFDRLDANRDNMISREEFAAMRAMRGQRMGGQRGTGGRLIGRADADRDGRISLAEMQDAAVRRFDMMDANRDGTLTPDERRSARERMRAMRGRQPA